MCSFSLNLLDQRESGFALNNTHDGLPVVLANHGICLPITNPPAFIDDGGAILDGEPVGNGAAPVCLSITLLALFLAAQVFPQQATSALVGVDSPIHRLWANKDMPADLLWTPLLQEHLLRELPRSLIDPARVDGAAFDGLAMCLFRAIATSSRVAFQFPADGCFASLQHFRYLALLVSCSLQRVNLVSFFSGEVCVVHFCNFDWPVKKAWMLQHPAHLTCVTQNCTSFLNSPKITWSKC